MKQKKIGDILLWISIAAFAMMSFSFLLIPVEAMGYFPGILFWLGFVTGTVTQVLLEFRRRRFFANYKVNRKRMQKPRCGALTCFSTPPAKATDAAMFIFTALFLLVSIWTKGIGYICFVLLGLTVMSFCLHCILNGRNYFFVKNYLKIRRALEDRKVSTKEREEKI